MLLYNCQKEIEQQRKRGKKDMWIFEAHYINMETEEESVIKIEFDGQFLGSEKEAYLYAMGKAYDRKKQRGMS